MSAAILAMFPGQGSQHVGMGKDLLAQFPKAKECFEEASDSIKVNVLDLCLNGPDEQLALTANTQPCILTVSVAVWRILTNETDLKPLAYAGHSLGEYSALVASEKLSFSRAVTLVRHRGEAMQKAVAPGVGAMAAVINPKIDELNTWCKEASNKTQSVEIVNYNSPQQVVIAGHKAAVDVVCAKLEVGGTRFVVLNVSAPFHSRLMEKAREAMTPLLNASDFKTNENKVITNLTGNSAQSYSADYLIKQIDSPVLWTQSMQSAEKLGCDVFLEIGPGKVLFGLGRRCVSNDKARFLVTTDIKKAITDLQAI